MNTDLRSLGQTGATPPAEPLVPAGPIAEDVKVIGGAYVTTEETQAGEDAARVKARELATRAANDFVASLFIPGAVSDAFFNSFQALVQLASLRAGAGPELELPDLPAYADTLLPEAVSAVEKAAPLLRDLVPSVARRNVLGPLSAAGAQVARGQRVLSILAPLYYGALAMRAQGRCVQDGVCREVFQKAEPEMGQHFTLNDTLDPLRRFIKASAEAAKETIKVKEEAAADAEEKTLERVKAALAQTLAGRFGPSAPAPVGPRGPATPPEPAVDPAALAAVLPEPVHGARGAMPKRTR